MPSRTLVVVAITILGITIAEHTRAAEQWTNTESRNGPARLIDELNECVQERFQDVDARFGFARVIEIGKTPHRFQPETVRDMNAVRELERQRLRIVLYLAGRNVMREKPRPRPGIPEGWGVVKGPVRVTPVDTEAVPSPLDLWDDSRRALAVFESRESYDFEVAGWNINGRAIRASSVMCLECHRDPTRGGTRLPVAPRAANEGPALRIGDALGVVMYAYRSTR